MIQRLKKTIIACLLLGGSLAAQTAGREEHDQAASEIRTLFNQKKFDAIYDRLSLEFKSATRQEDFIAFLGQSLYTPLGEIGSIDFTGAEQGVYSYLLQFKAARLNMSLSVNALGQIEGLQFLPSTAPMPAKIQEYASDNSRKNALDLFVDSLVKPYMQSPENCGLSIGLSQGGTSTFYNYGETKRNSRQLPGQATIYEIGSLSKTFCGLLLAHAILDKKIKADDDIRRYLPGHYPSLTFNKQPILVKHLANHSSGLPRIPDDLPGQPGADSLNPYQHYGRQQILASLKTATLSAPPGSKCDYSNLGMALLGLILEDLYQQSFETLVKEKIAIPNGMTSTAINLSAGQAQRFADGYNQNGEPTPHWELGGFAAAGALRSSAEDLLRYLDYNLAEKDGATQLAHTITYKGREVLGLAWFIKATQQGNTLIWHNGGTFGFSCFGGFIREKNSSLIVLSNSAGNADRIAIALLNYLQR